MPPVKRNIRKEIEERSLKDVWKYTKRLVRFLFNVDRFRFTMMSIIELLKVLLPIASLFLIQGIINDILDKKINIYYIIAWSIIALITKLCYSYTYKNDQIFNQLIKTEALKELFGKVTDLRIEDFESKELHNSANRADNAIYNFSWLFRTGRKVFFNIIKIVSYITIIVVWKYWFLGFILIMPIINIVRTSKVLKENFIRRWELTELRRKANYYGLLMYRLETLKELKVLNVNEKYLKKHNNHLYKLQEEQIKLENNYYNEINRVQFIEQIFQVGYFIYLVIETASGRILIGNFNTYRSAFQNIHDNIDETINDVLNISIWLLEAKEYFDFLDYDNNYSEGLLELNKIETIEFKNVEYKYNNSKTSALKGISFKINAGEKIAFIGENGSGKTTALKLLMKIYKANKGEIFINDININEYTTKSVRERITMLMQEFNRFEETVKENITLSEENINPKKIYDKIPFDDFKKKIKELPQKTQTMLGSWFGEGVEFSKGQIQKLALSRIFYKDVDCYILDEPNSALDPRSEKDLFQYMKKKMNGKTSISTLHVFTNIDIMDNIIMFHEGKILCQGTHEELYKNNEEYKDYYNLQERSLEDEKE